MDSDLKDDIAFVKQMLSHHQEAMNMAKSEMGNEDDSSTEDPGVQKIVKAVMASHMKEMDMMTSWLKANDNKKSSSVDFIWDKK